MAALLSLILGILGNAISILVFSSPLPTFWKIHKRKATENFKSLPYVCTLLSTSLWTYYGLMKPGGTLIFTINAAGTAFQAFYVTVFLVYAPRKRKIRTSVLALLLNGLCFGVILVATLVGIREKKKRLLVVGAICSAISVSMYAAPMAAMRSVIRTRSVEYMPFFLSLFLFLNGAVWSLYAFLVKDVFVEIPNVIGFFLGCIQLSLYFCYKNAKPRKLEEKEDSMKLAEDIEMGPRSMSLPKQFNHSKQNSLPKQRSLPAKILKASSATVRDILNFLQDNDPIKRHEEVSDDHKHLKFSDAQTTSPQSPHKK